MPRLMKLGNSIALVLPETMCKKLGWKAKDEVLVNIDNYSAKLWIERIEEKELK